MTDKVLVANKKTTGTDIVESFYTSAASDGTVIKAFTASNDTGINRSYKAYIYDQSGNAVSAIVPFKIVIRNRFDMAPSAVGHVIPEGGSLRMETSLASSISFYVTGEDQ